jgi:hypothetical protein
MKPYQDLLIIKKFKGIHMWAAEDVSQQRENDQNERVAARPLSIVIEDAVKATSALKTLHAELPGPGSLGWRGDRSAR